MTMSKVHESEGRDKYEPIKRLAMVQIEPARSPSKPFTSFCIKDILGIGAKDQDGNHHSCSFHSHHRYSLHCQQSQPRVPHRPGNQGSGHKYVSRDGKLCHESNRDGKVCDEPARDGKLCLESTRDGKLCHEPTRGGELCLESTRDGKLCHEPTRDEKLCLESSRDGKLCHELTREGKRCLESTRDSRRRDTNRRDKTHRELLNLCRVDRARPGLRPLSPALRSNPANACARLSLWKLPHRHVGLREQTGQPALPVNMSTKIVRPWDSDLDAWPMGCQRTPAPSLSPGAVLSASRASSEEDDEISVDDDPQPAPVIATRVSKNSTIVSPLDALMAMTSKTFQGLEGDGPADTKRREQTTLFGKHQASKKRRKSRTAFTNQQIYELEKRFLYQKYLTPADRDEISASLGLTNAQVITWFQNRRAKLKRDLEELKNDVTAAKKLPLQKCVPDTFIELGRRKVQGQTARESSSSNSNSSALHSPASTASVQDEPEDTGRTPGTSPCQDAVKDEDHVLTVSESKQQEAMDTSFIADVNEERQDWTDHNHVTVENMQKMDSCFLRDNTDTHQQTQPRGLTEYNESPSLDGTTFKIEDIGDS